MLDTPLGPAAGRARGRGSKLQNQVRATWNITTQVQMIGGFYVKNYSRRDVRVLKQAITRLLTSIYKEQVVLETNRYVGLYAITQG